MADMQAVLWYAEKLLYEKGKIDDDTKDDSEGYADDKAPAYANAVSLVASNA